jgi:hypothetical protein
VGKKIRMVLFSSGRWEGMGRGMMELSRIIAMFFILG